MNYATALLGMIALGFVAGPAIGQTPKSAAKPNAGMTEPVAIQMSEGDKKAWTNCKAMSPEAMKKDATCARIIKDHPDAKKWKPTKPGAAKPDVPGSTPK